MCVYLCSACFPHSSTVQGPNQGDGATLGGLGPPTSVSPTTTVFHRLPDLDNPSLRPSSHVIRM